MKKVLLIGSVALLGAWFNKTVETLTNVPPESIVFKRYTNTKHTVVDQIEIMWWFQPTTKDDAIYSVGTLYHQTCN